MKFRKENTLVMIEALKKAKNLKEELDAYRPIDPQTENRIMQKFRLDWNYHSNHIEGNQLTYGETKALLLHGITAQGKPLKDHFEITGHNMAVNAIMDIIQSKRELNENFIKEFHQILLKESYEVDAITSEGQPTKKKINVGMYKTSPNHVKTKTGEIFYFATPEETPAKMYDLINWYREKESEIDPIILAAEFHYRFIRIHPFDDGNGRLARLLMNFIFMKAGYPPVVIKTEDKENYFSVLQQADGGHINAFIKYITENVVHSLRLMILGAKGEEVEEPDDVLKQLRLMEQEIEHLSKQDRETLKSASSVFEIYQKSWSPLLNGIQEAIEPIAKNFSNNEYVVTYNKGSKKEDLLWMNRHVDIQQLNASIKNSINSYWAMNNILVVVRFSDLKKLPNCKEPIQTSLRITLKEDRYVIDLENSDLLIEHKYPFTLSLEEIKAIYHQLLKSLTRGLKHLIESCK